MLFLLGDAGKSLKKKMTVSVQSRVDSVNRISLTQMGAYGRNLRRVSRIRGCQKERWLRSQLPVQRRRPTSCVWEMNVIQGHLCYRVFSRPKSAGLHYTARSFYSQSTGWKPKVDNYLGPIRLPGCFPQHPPTLDDTTGFCHSKSWISFQWNIRQCYGAESEEREERTEFSLH